MDLEVARTRARRRLICMLVLVVAGVLGFPWLFETQPRPLSQDVQIVQAPSAGGAALPEGAGSRALSGRVGIAGINPPIAQTGNEGGADVDGGSPARETELPDPAPEREANAKSVATAVSKVAEAAAPAAVAKSVVSAAKPEPVKTTPQADKKAQTQAKPADKVADKPAEKKPVDKKAADTKADTKAADKKPADKAKEAADKAKSNQRYVVQFGAFADNAAAQAARAKAERAGLKTYAQTVDTPAGKRTRVRVGPYADKAEADKANATLRKAGLAGSILTL
jgi:DedD protein